MPKNNKRASVRQHWPVPMSVKASPIEGQGLFTKVSLRTRQKIGEFTGKLITQKEARRQAKAQRWIAIVEVNDSKAIDASQEMAGFRFINHSCTPNTFLRIIGERAEFYALRPIPANTELTLDCHPSHHNGKLPCHCQSANCRGFL